MPKKLFLVGNCVAKPGVWNVKQQLKLLTVNASLQMVVRPASRNSRIPRHRPPRMRDIPRGGKRWTGTRWGTDWGSSGWGSRSTAPARLSGCTTTPNGSIHSSRTSACQLPWVGGQSSCPSTFRPALTQCQQWTGPKSGPGLRGTRRRCWGAWERGWGSHRSWRACRGPPENSARWTCSSADVSLVPQGNAGRTSFRFHQGRLFPRSQRIHSRTSRVRAWETLGRCKRRFSRFWCSCRPPRRSWAGGVWAVAWARTSPAGPRRSGWAGPAGRLLASWCGEVLEGSVRGIDTRGTTWTNIVQVGNEYSQSVVLGATLQKETYQPLRQANLERSPFFWIRRVRCWVNELLVRSWAAIRLFFSSRSVRDWKETCRKSRAHDFPTNSCPVPHGPGGKDWARSQGLKLSPALTQLPDNSIDLLSPFSLLGPTRDDGEHQDVDTKHHHTDLLHLDRVPPKEIDRGQEHQRKSDEALDQNRPDLHPNKRVRNTSVNWQSSV